MNEISLSKQDKQILLGLARRAITLQTTGSENPQVEELQAYPDRLQIPGASFVTLHINGNLRGCIGSLQATKSLVLDVWENAQASALRDPRFPPLSADELDDVNISISVLTPPKRLEVKDEKDLIKKIRPGVDGLTITSGFHKATFLPAVWETLSTPEQFLFHLKQKAGIPVTQWPEDMQVERYQSIYFTED